jgi:transcriptional regulator with XRE-family HTH domain
MNYLSMTDNGIAAELGNRLEALRLQQNISQQEIAEEIGITAKSYRQLVGGGGKLENMIAAMRALDCLDQLDSFLPEPVASPIAQWKQKGKERKRARSKKEIKQDIELKELDW